MGGVHKRDRACNLGHKVYGGGRGPREDMVGDEGWREGVNNQFWGWCLWGKGNCQIVIHSA